MTLTGNQTQWFCDMIDNEILQIEGAARNEYIWANGADGDEVEMHEKNAEELKSYAEFLRTLEETYA